MRQGSQWLFSAGRSPPSTYQHSRRDTGTLGTVCTPCSAGPWPSIACCLLLLPFLLPTIAKTRAAIHAAACASTPSRPSLTSLGRLGDEGYRRLGLVQLAQLAKSCQAGKTPLRAGHCLALLPSMLKVSRSLAQTSLSLRAGAARSPRCPESLFARSFCAPSLGRQGLCFGATAC
jgi:hypothetical protein